MPNSPNADHSGGSENSRHATHFDDGTPIRNEDKSRPGFGAGIFFLAWAVVGWYGLVSNVPVWSSLGAPGLDPGPAVLPVIACSALTLGGLWYLAVGIVQSEGGFDRQFLATLRIPALFYSSILILVIASTMVGFRWAGLGLATVWLFVLGTPSGGIVRRVAIALALGLLIMGVLELVFVQALRVPLP